MVIYVMIHVYDDGPWDDEMRKKWKEIYTNAWVRLQQQYNPNWFEETHDLHALAINVKSTTKKA